MSAVRFYEVRGAGVSRREWGRFFLTDDGLLTVYSSYGCYGHWWTHPGGEIRAFLVDCDELYVAGKFAGGASEYDSEETIKRMEQEICRLRRQKDLTRDEARAEWSRLADFGDLSSERDLHLWFEETLLHSHVDVLSEFVVHTLPSQLRHFMRQLWPTFIEKLKEELRAEAEAPSTLAEAAAGPGGAIARVKSEGST